jgi:polysaccharide deacetylase 2 family uncharacterized protein YibQ
MVAGLILAVSLILPPSPSLHPDDRPVYENFFHISPDTAELVSTIQTCSLDHGRLPMLAIVIDDMGYDLDINRAFIELDAPLSFAFLPFAPHTESLARLAYSREKDVLVHLPLEPERKNINPGPGTITLSMDRDDTLRLLNRAIAAVPGASGVNNHMGSAYTANVEHMTWILHALKGKEMFFLDSRTTKLSKAWDVAYRMNVPATWRDVFLDHVPDERSVRKELERAVKIAVKNGSAVAIGHPHEVTLRVLYRELPLVRKHVRLVPVHMLLCRVRK